MNERSRTLWLEDEGATEALGGSLATLGEGGVLFLQGDLGAGKTTLTRGLLRALGHAGSVKSPTYTLVEPYEALQPPVYHFDLYRLGEPEELEFMGIRDYFATDCLAVVEWPERGAGVLPEPDCRVTLSVADGGREVRIQAFSERGRRFFDAACGRKEVRHDSGV